MLLPLDTIAALLFLTQIEVSRNSPKENLSESLLCMALAGLVVYLSSRLARVLTLRFMARRSSLAHSGLAGTVFLALRILVVGIFILTLYSTSWTSSLAGLLGFTANPFVKGLVGIFPYLMFNFLSWWALYPLHLRTAPGDWTLGRFLVHRSRYSFFILGIGLPGIALTMLDASAFFKPFGVYGEYFQEALSFLSLPLIIWIFPAFLRFFWGCRRLPSGATRDRVLALQKKTGVKFSQICVWNLGGKRVANAAVVGVFPPFRYLFLSEGLLAQMSDSEIEAVVCHEMGHVRHWHLVLYLVIGLPVILFLEQALTIVSQAGVADVVMIPLYVLGLAVYFRFGFAFFSRRMERQADLYALEAQGSSAPLRQALEKIAVLAGNIRDHPSWHHGSIAERVRFLQKAEDNPELAKNHHQHVASLNFVVMTCAALSLYFVFSGGSSTEQLTYAPTHYTTATSGSAAVEAHWLRVRKLLPDDPRGAENLARHYLSLGTLSAAAKALDFAKEARRQARNEAERARLDILIQTCKSRRLRISP